MSDQTEVFINILAENLKAGNITAEQIRQLTDLLPKQDEPKRRRGRPNKIKATPQSKLSVGRPVCNNSRDLKCRVMGLWVMLSRVDMPKMEKRRIIMVVSKKSAAFVDKAIARLNLLIDRGLAIAVYSPKTGKVLILPTEDAEALQLAWENGVDIEPMLENSEHFQKLELQKIILP